MNSIHLGRVFGIDIRVHFLFVLMMLFFAVSMGTAQVLMVGLLFVLVLLHELGHSLVAQHFGIRVLDITFWPLGGMARMSEIPENARVEGLIAIAGPAVNFVLALLGVPMLVLAGGLEATGSMPGLAIHSLADFAGGFIALNLMLGTFNLLPAFPMDGGRILRAFLGRRGDWVRATETAVRVGRFVALGMCVVGVFARPMILALPIIGIFIWWTGFRELWAVRLRHGMAPLAGGFTFPGGPGSPGGPGQPGGPGPDPFGIFRQPTGDAPRETEAPPPKRGFSTEDVERLESFRGRLKRPD